MRFTRTRASFGEYGFTIIELAIVLIIASVLLGLAVPRIQATFHQRDVESARDGMILMAARARSMAMEEAEIVMLRLRPDIGVTQIIRGGATIETFRFQDDLGVRAASEIGNVVMCYTARGFAVEPCSTHLSTPAVVEFSRDGHTASLEVWQLGQVRKL